MILRGGPSRRDKGIKPSCPWWTSTPPCWTAWGSGRMLEDGSLEAPFWTLRAGERGADRVLRVLLPGNLHRHVHAAEKAYKVCSLCKQARLAFNLGRVPRAGRTWPEGRITPLLEETMGVKSPSRMGAAGARLQRRPSGSCFAARRPGGIFKELQTGAVLADPPICPGNRPGWPGRRIRNHNP